MSGSPLVDLLQTYRQGRLSRDEYWRQMEPLHRTLRDHCGLVQASGIDRIEIGPQNLFVVFDDGLRMVWNPEDIRGAANVVVNHGDYESQPLRVLDFLAQSCQTALDIGANAGYVALRLGRVLAERGGVVHAFEPVSKTNAELACNVRINRLDDVVHTHDVAFGESSGTCHFFIPDFHGSVAASQRPLFPQHENRQVDVRMMRLDDFVARQPLHRVDLIKCDVEGAELFVLRGGLETIREHRPMIMLEMLRKWAKAYEYHPDDIIELLSRIDYRCCSYSDHKLIEHRRIGDDVEATNFFFFHRRHADVRRQIEAGRHLTPRRGEAAA